MPDNNPPADKSPQAAQPTDERDDLDLPLPGTASCPWRTAELPGIGGRIGPEMADFQVDEIANYAPEGEGDHWFVRLEKTGLSTPAVRQALARATGVEARDIGFAGRKDSHAVTTQWFSLPARTGAQAPEITPIDGVEILEFHRHGKKLRLGHLTGNAFTVRVVDADPEAAARLPALAEALARGMPNYYGGQRFGSRGRSLRQALEFAARPRRRVRDPRFLASVMQSAIFNAWLGARVADGLLDEAVAGDVMRKRETGGVFLCDDPAVDGPRVAAGELDPTGPMPGPKLMTAEGPAKAREVAAAVRFRSDLQLGALHRFAPGTRRVARVVPEGLSWQAEADGVWVMRFTLPSGAYATTVLAELMHPVEIEPQ